MQGDYVLICKGDKSLIPLAYGNETGKFQTFHLCENPPHAPANGNFILTLIQCVLASNIIFH